MSDKKKGLDSFKVVCAEQIKPQPVDPNVLYVDMYITVRKGIVHMDVDVDPTLHMSLPICCDHDGDCKDVSSPTRCWLYAPELGMCPLLSGG